MGVRLAYTSWRLWSPYELLFWLNLLTILPNSGKEEESSDEGIKRSLSRSIKSRILNKLRTNGKSGRYDASAAKPAQAKKPAITRVEPRVLHGTSHSRRDPRNIFLRYQGYTLTKEITFREVCEAIRDTAFVHR